MKIKILELLKSPNEPRPRFPMEVITIQTPYIFKKDENANDVRWNVEYSSMVKWFAVGTDEQGKLYSIWDHGSNLARLYNQKGVFNIEMSIMKGTVGRMYLTTRIEIF